CVTARLPKGAGPAPRKAPARGGRARRTTARRHTQRPGAQRTDAPYPPSVRSCERMGAGAFSLSSLVGRRGPGRGGFSILSHLLTVYEPKRCPLELAGLP